MKPKTDRRIYRVANALLILSIVFMGTALYCVYQTQIDERYTALAIAFTSLHLVAYIVLKEIGMMFDELKDKPKSDKEEKQLANLAESERNIPPKTRIPLYTKVEIAGRLGKNAGRGK